MKPEVDDPFANRLLAIQLFPTDFSQRPFPISEKPHHIHVIALLPRSRLLFHNEAIAHATVDAAPERAEQTILHAFNATKPETRRCFLVMPFVLLPQKIYLLIY